MEPRSTDHDAADGSDTRADSREHIAPSRVAKRGAVTHGGVGRLGGRLVAALVLLTGSAWLVHDDNGPQRDAELVVFAADSASDSFEALADAFERDHPGVEVLYSFDSSTPLANQIVDGAQVDVFAAADPQAMALIDGLTDTDPRAFATNRIALAVPVGNPGGVSGVADLARADLVVGVCDISAPCGRLAADSLAVMRAVARFDSYEPSARALYVKLEARQFDLALVYESDVRTSAGKVEALSLGAFDLPVATYEIASLAASDQPALARAFVDFSLSTSGQRVFREHGFNAP